MIRNKPPLAHLPPNDDATFWHIRDGRDDFHAFTGYAIKACLTGLAIIILYQFQR